MKDYEIIGGNTLAMLEDEVNKKIKLGYVPVGGIFIIQDAIKCLFQAMVKEELK